jgi:hypothetical protein
MRFHVTRLIGFALLFAVIGCHSVGSSSSDTFSSREERAIRTVLQEWLSARCAA